MGDYSDRLPGGAWCIKLILILLLQHYINYILQQP